MACHGASLSPLWATGTRPLVLAFLACAAWVTHTARRSRRPTRTSDTTVLTCTEARHAPPTKRTPRASLPLGPCVSSVLDDTNFYTAHRPPGARHPRRLPLLTRAASRASPAATTLWNDRAAMRTAVATVEAMGALLTRKRQRHVAGMCVYAEGTVLGPGYRIVIVIRLQRRGQRRRDRPMDALCAAERRSPTLRWGETESGLWFIFQSRHVGGGTIRSSEKVSYVVSGAASVGCRPPGSPGDGRVSHGGLAGHGSIHSHYHGHPRRSTVGAQHRSQPASQLASQPASQLLLHWRDVAHLCEPGEEERA